MRTERRKRKGTALRHAARQPDAAATQDERHDGRQDEPRCGQVPRHGLRDQGRVNTQPTARITRPATRTSAGPT